MLLVGFQLLTADSLNYTSPVDHQIRLTGNFMEIRNNHFHSGIDIKSSKGVSGDNIRAVEDGYVSRVKIQSGSYGNAVYVDHPATGHTSLYAHLSAFDSQLENYLKEIQYHYESFEVDIYLPPGIIEFNKGDVIGKMGNSGRSFGPHLHFELRDTQTEEPLNPEMLGVGPTDNRHPVLERLIIYELGQSNELLNSSSRYFSNQGPDYKLHNDLIAVSSPNVAFGLQMHDYMDGSYNKNGVYGYRLFENDSLIFSWSADKFSFDQNRCLNGFIDFEQRKEGGHKVYLLYQQDCNHFSYYKSQTNGIISISPKSNKRIRIEAFDLYGNVSTINLKIDKQGDFQYIDDQIFLCDSSYTLEQSKFIVELTDYSLFSDDVIDITETKTKIDGLEWDAVRVGKTNQAVKNYFKIKTETSSLLEPEKWTIVSKDSRGRLIHFGKILINGNLVSHIDQFGTFILFKDEQAPTISGISIGNRSGAPWKLQIRDNLIPDGKVDDLNYRGTINGNWLRLKYDLKNDMLLFEDFDKIPNGPFEFILKVVDDCGNESTYTYQE